MPSATKQLVAVAALVLSVTGCGESTERPVGWTPADSATTTSLTSDANNIAAALKVYQAENGQYPTVAAAELAPMLNANLSSTNYVAQYVSDGTQATICITTGTGNAWTILDATTGEHVIGQGEAPCKETTP